MASGGRIWNRNNREGGLHSHKHLAAKAVNRLRVESMLLGGGDPSKAEIEISCDLGEVQSSSLLVSPVSDSAEMKEMERKDAR